MTKTLEANRKHIVQVTFGNGAQIITDINGTPDSVCDYYIGKFFNLGNAENDNMQRAEKIGFFDGSVFLTHKRSIKD